MPAVAWKSLVEARTRWGTMRGSATGQGPVMVFVHGNPTSGFLWRKVVAGLTGDFRCVVLDLMGMGRSEVPAVPLTVTQHGEALDDALVCLRVGSATLVGHDWGAVLALDHAARHPGHGHRVAACEGHLRPIDSWAGTDPGFRELFTRLRDPNDGKQLVIEDNVFVTDVLLGSLPWLSDDERAAYLAPSSQRGTREAIWQLIRAIPIEGEPAEMLAVMDRVQFTLASRGVPVLLLCGDPGSVVDAAVVAWAQGIGQALEVVQIGPGSHFLPEEQPRAIAKALTRWA